MKDITVEELKAKMEAKEDFYFLDVREQEEYDNFNLGAELIPLATLPANLDKLEPYKNKEVVVHCRSGARSANAKAFLMQNGFSNVRNLLGGVLDWQKKYN